MLSLFDDYPIHQSADPIRQPQTSDRNAYDRYFANGYDRGGEYYFAFALGRYANRGVMDASLTVVTGGIQHSFHASRRDPDEPTDMRIGPLSLEIVNPLRSMRVRLAPNDSGVTCDLTYTARSAPLQERRDTRRAGDRLVADATRLTQFGCWEGWIEVDGDRRPVRRDQTPGVKDRSWGIRAVGEPWAGRPDAPRSIFWNWLPFDFGDFAVHSLHFENHLGELDNEDSVWCPLYPSEADVPINEERVRHLGPWQHEYTFAPGPRRITGGRVRLGAALPSRHDGTHPLGSDIEIGEPLLTAWMVGLGYGNHPEWGHGLWKGELATGHERWRTDDVDLTQPRHMLMHQVVQVTCGGVSGFGFVEQFILGPYQPYGLTGATAGRELG